MTPTRAMPRYKLRTLLILLAIGPPMLAYLLGEAVDFATMERRIEFCITVWFALIVTIIFWDWQRNRGHFRRS
jgi:hypothetical protein